MKSRSTLASFMLLFAISMIGCTSHDNPYTPGMGELMSSIQLHHAKLWFAGKNQNWQLAEYNQSLIRPFPQ